MPERRHPNVVNVDEVDATEMKKGAHHAQLRRLGTHAGNAQIGATLTTLPPGGLSFPFHYHCANEEAIYVVSGTGAVRIGDARVPVRAGDWIALPIGPEHAHQMINDGKEPLIYLCVSTAHKCEVVGYPESKKVAAWAGPSAQNPWLRWISREGESLDYWENEPNAT
jgi:uncharacterized cupin superfamily protein